jgi:hypothetical protein
MNYAKDNIKMHLKVVVCEGKEQIKLAGIIWWSLLNTVINVTAF